MICVIDSSAWIEYLNGSKAGEKVREILIGENNVYVIAPIISEVISKVKSKKGNVEIAYSSIIKNSRIFEITPRIAREAGVFHASKKEEFGSFPLIDSLIICSAKSLNAKIVSLDNHIKTFKDIIFLDK